MASFIFQKIMQKARDLGITKQSVEVARNWFRDAARRLKTASASNVMVGDDSKYARSNRITAKMVGKMILFFYDPKWKKELPYYDTFPLIFPIEHNPEKCKNGFLGINMHYLPPKARAQLMNALYTTVEKPMTEQQRFRINYGILKGAARFSLFKPCIKCYLYGHVRSRFYLVPPEEWDYVLMLPLERFEKAPKSRVWRESLGNK